MCALQDDSCLGKYLLTPRRRATNDYDPHNEVDQRASQGLDVHVYMDFQTTAELKPRASIFFNNNSD